MSAEPSPGLPGAPSSPSDAGFTPSLPLFALAAVAAWSCAGGPLHQHGPGLALFLALLAGLALPLLATRGRSMPSPERVALAALATGVALGSGSFLTARLLAADGCGCESPLGVAAAGLLDGALIGLVATLPLLPLAVLVARACRATLRARPGSLVAAADRRAVYLTTMATMAACAASAELFRSASLSSPLLCRFTPVTLALLAGGAVVAALVAARDIAALRTCLEAAGAPGEPTYDEPGDGLEERSADFVDLGVGDERIVFTLDDGDPYRGQRRGHVLVAGNVEMAHAILVAHVQRDLLVALVAAAAAVLSLTLGR